MHALIDVDCHTYFGVRQRQTWEDTQGDCGSERAREGESEGEL